MAKSSQKKTPEQKAADLAALIGTGGGVSTLSQLTSQGEAGAPPLAINSILEQEGEKAPATPTVATPVVEPVSSVTTPVAAAPSEAVPVEDAQPAILPTEPAATPEPTPSPTPVVAQSEAPESPTSVEQPIAPVATPSAAPAPTVETAPLEHDEPVSEDASPTVAGEDEDSFDLASLFLKTTERKHIVARLSQRQYDYLNTLGAMLGNRASVPDILFNLVEQFIVKHDKKVQKAVTKQIRQVRNSFSASSKKS
jgi:hypothetical protein